MPTVRLFAILSKRNNTLTDEIKTSEQRQVIPRICVYICGNPRKCVSFSSIDNVRVAIRVKK